MKRNVTKTTVVLAAGAILFAGCAKKELVKKEEPVSPPPVAATPEKRPGKADGAAKPGEEALAVKEEPLREAPPVKEEPADQATQQAELKLETVYFDYDSFLLSQEAREQLSRNADMLGKNPAIRLQIEGYCDERGSDEYNLALGEKRAKAVLEYLTGLGLPAERFSLISYGEENPADQGHDETAWARNRRVELKIVR